MANTGILYDDLHSLLKCTQNYDDKQIIIVITGLGSGGILQKVSTSNAIAPAVNHKFRPNLSPHSISIINLLVCVYLMANYAVLIFMHLAQSTASSEELATVQSPTVPLASPAA